MEDLGKKKRRKTMPLLNVGLTATSPMHEIKEKQKKHQYRSTRFWSNIISVGNEKLSFSRIPLYSVPIAQHINRWIYTIGRP
jgi:exo-beta-1,3-glucanase (GH17 family)